MEKQRTKSFPSVKHRMLGRMFYVSGILICGAMIWGILFWRNPFVISKVDASDESASEQVEDTMRYIQVEHMDLQFTGFYTVDTKDKICGYYYIGSIGDVSWFVEIPAEVDDGGLSQAMPDLTDMNFTAQICEAVSVLEKAAENEGMTTSEYMEHYHISDQILVTYDTGREADILYYAIAFFAMLGCFAAGRLMTLEMLVTKKEGQVEAHE